MAKQTSTPVNQQGNSAITWQGRFSLEQREAMIREIAYHRYVQRGYVPGHHVDDWLAAEAEFDRGTPETLPGVPPEFPPETEVQQSSVHSTWEDEELKRIVRQHPQKAIPQVESIEPEKAPFKE